MAHHNNTPASVLDAPTVTHKWIASHDGPNREARRHAHTSTGKRGTVPKALRPLATNVPYVKPKKG